MPVAAALGALATPSLGLAAVAAWIGAVLFCEAWTWIATRPAVGSAMSARQMVVYIVSGAVTLPTWAALGLLFWTSDTPGGAAIAVALWTGQLLYTQRLIFESRLGVLVGNSAICAMMVGAPLLHPRMGGTQQILFLIAVLFGIGFAIHGSLTALGRIQSLADRNAEIEKAATTDALTGLPNRAQFIRMLNERLSERASVRVLYMDLDHFKLVNDSLGHSAGDTLLRQFGGRLLELSPPGAMIARLGGDEFALLASEPHGAPAPEVDGLCRQILAAVKAPFKLANGQAHVGLSIGVASEDGGPPDAEDLVRRADIALYAVKGSGRDDYRLFSADLDADVRERATLEAALRADVDAGRGLWLAYQPKLDRSGRVTGVEALLRWEQEGRPVSPARFVTIAEECGLIVPLGLWVFREALGFAHRWPDLCVAVNVSPVQLRDPDFVDQVLAEILAAGVSASQLEIEVTETVLFEPSASATTALDRLRKAGFRVALDDFGTGYSSLRHLHSFAVDRVKIDQSFVRSLGEGVEAAAIIQAVIQLGHAMNLQITAEGVETHAQRNFLLQAGTDELQGYLFSRPLTEADLARFLALSTVGAAA